MDLIIKIIAFLLSAWLFKWEIAFCKEMKNKNGGLYDYFVKIMPRAPKLFLWMSPVIYLYLTIQVIYLSLAIISSVIGYLK